MIQAAPNANNLRPDIVRTPWYKKATDNAPNRADGNLDAKSVKPNTEYESASNQ